MTFLHTKRDNIIILQGISLAGLFISYAIESYMVKESFSVCAQIGLIWIVGAFVKANTYNSIPDYDAKKYFINRQVGMSVIISLSKVQKLTNKIIDCMQ